MQRHGLHFDRMELVRLVRFLDISMLNTTTIIDNKNYRFVFSLKAYKPF